MFKHFIFISYLSFYICFLASIRLVSICACHSRTFILFFFSSMCFNAYLLFLYSPNIFRLFLLLFYGQQSIFSRWPLIIFYGSGMFLFFSRHGSSTKATVCVYVHVVAQFCYAWGLLFVHLMEFVYHFSVAHPFHSIFSIRVRISFLFVLFFGFAEICQSI